MKPDGKRRCLTARSARERDNRAREYRQKPDGWEDEFGPVPLRVPHTKWYDDVVVLRLLNGENPGRRPYRLEWEAFFKRNKTVTFQQVLQATGLTSEALREKCRDHGYRWPRDLTDMGKMGRKAQ